MDHRTRMNRINRLISVYRRKRDKSVMVTLSCVCAVLCGGLGIMLYGEMGPGEFIVQENYGAVLLSGSQSPYFIIALLAFLAGVTFTLICIKGNQMRKRRLREEGQANAKG